MVFYKYLIWEYMFLEYDNILHLDADTLVRAPLDTLLEKKEFFIVRNNLYFKEVQVLDTSNNLEGVLEETLGRFGLDRPGPVDMVNAGVFVVPKSYRTADQYRLLLKLTHSFAPYLKYADQSALSLWCMKNKIQISDAYQYNFQMPVFNKFFMSRYKGNLDVGTFFNKKKEILSQIDIIHFSGAIKPDTRKFLKWTLMGRYAKLFSDCYHHYRSHL
jgi:lipopolysaccharide biosynthesis glycosyltransferase